MVLPEELELLESTPGAVVAVGDDGRIAFASPQALAYLGWDASLVGRPLTTIIPERLRRSHLEGFGRYVRTGESRLQGQPVRVPALRRDGSEAPLDLAIRVFRRPDGSKLVTAALTRAEEHHPTTSLVFLETTFQRRLYELI